MHIARRLIVPLGLLALLAGCSKPAVVDEPVRAVRSITLQASGATVQHDYAAEIRARVESRLGFRVPGKLVKRLVNPGDAVRAGQLLAQIDATDLVLGRDAAQSSLNSANAALALSEAEYRRYKELRDQGFISGLELERRAAALTAARAQAEQARSQAGVQANQTGYAQLLADVSGVVTGIDAEPGAVLAAGATVLRLAQDGPRDAVFSVPEDRIASLRALLNKPGALKLRLWGAPDGATTPATVREVSAAADPATRTFLVKADVGAAPVRLGQTASVLIDGAVAAGVIKLPLNAVFEQGGNSAVWLVDPATMTVKAQPIAVGGAEGNLVLVAGGLSPGQVVVTAGVHVLTPGQKVRWYQEPAAPAAAPAVAVPAAGLAPAPAATAR
jgi:multidrug efflux system membrane fusion protein